MRDANRISSSSAVAKLTGRRRALYRAGDPTIIRTAANPMASVPNQKPARCLPIAAISATNPSLRPSFALLNALSDRQQSP